MKVIMCLDNNDGYMFNKRRQSRDREVMSDIADIIKHSSLLYLPFSEDIIDSYSSVFEENGVEYNSFCCVDDISIFETEESVSEFEDAYFFNESEELENILENIDTLIIYRWNRDYPADKYLDISLSDFILVSSEDFVGSSHDNITREIYEKE